MGLSPMVDAAVIVAAGFGSRLGPLTELQPKGFLEVSGRSLIQRSVDTLADVGIRTLWLGTGYRREAYEAFARQNTQLEISCVYSEAYATTSSMYTLYNLRRVIDRPFLLLESDLLYEPRALRELIEDPRPDLVLGSDATGSGDEVYLEADDDGCLVGASKDRQALSHVSAELVGISKLSLQTYEAMCALMEANLETNPKLDYEGALASLGSRCGVRIKRVDGLAWCEIDDADHLSRALEKILPRIEAASR